MRIAIFDFDDTLFPTTHYSEVKRNTSNDTPFEPPKYDDFTNVVKATLALALSLADKVMIISNAQKEWIELIQSQYLPDCEEMKKIEIFTVRDTHIEKLYDVPEWKLVAFQNNLAAYFLNDDNHELLCFGDSPHDRDAAIACRNLYPNVIVKHFNFAMHPTPNHLLMEHKCVIEHLPYVCQQSEHMDLGFMLHTTSNAITMHLYYIKVTLPNQVDLPDRVVSTKVGINTKYRSDEEEYKMPTYATDIEKLFDIL